MKSLTATSISFRYTRHKQNLFAFECSRLIGKRDFKHEAYLENLNLSFRVNGSIRKQNVCEMQNSQKLLETAY